MQSNDLIGTSLVFAKLKGTPRTKLVFGELEGTPGTKLVFGELEGTPRTNWSLVNPKEHLRQSGCK